MSKPTAEELNVNLTPPPLKPVAGSPWSDDALQREGIASELSKLAATLARGEESATIALDGGYGTGKTFILRRWVQELQDHGRVAVYYNAWENDCDDDPLVSLIETLASDAKAKKWREATWGVLNEAVEGVVRKYTGVDVRKVRNVVADGQKVGLLDAAAARRQSRQELKRLLADLVEEPGVIVIIDELDRCRPTFATELMERVKHVLNVPGLVFVFGVNMVALRETVRARYGEIDAHQYLLRMFTATLHMPPGVVFQGLNYANYWGEYLNYLAGRHRLRQFCANHRSLDDDLERSLYLLELAATGGGFTPRELERVMWLIGNVASSSLLPDGQATVIFPDVLLPLVVARVKEPGAYYQTASIPDNGQAVIDCFVGMIREPDQHESDIELLDALEMTMYRVCHWDPPHSNGSDPPAYVALHEFTKEGGAAVLDSRHLARRSSGITRARARKLLRAAPKKQRWSANRGMIFDLTFEFLQRLTSRFDVVWPRNHQP